MGLVRITQAACGQASSAAATSCGAMLPWMPKSLSGFGMTQRTRRSPSSMAWNTDLWQLRAAMTVLPAGASARMPASSPTVAPLTR